MKRKSLLFISLHLTVILLFAFIAVASSSSSSSTKSNQELYDAGYQIGYGLGKLMNSVDSIDVLECDSLNTVTKNAMPEVALN